MISDTKLDWYIKRKHAYIWIVNFSSMTRKELQDRTKQLHVNVIRLYELLPRNAAGSVGANYRATIRAKSTADFIYKIQVVLEEADETLYWLEIIKASNLLEESDLLEKLIKEANELTSIFAATDKTAKTNLKIRKQEQKINQTSKNQKS